MLRAALKEFTRHGYAGTSMDAVATRAKVTKGLVFHHFGSKQALYAACLEQIYAKLRRRQDETALTGLGPIEAIRQLSIETFRLFREAPEIVAMMNEENLHRAAHVRRLDSVPSLYDKLIGELANSLRAGAEAGLFRADVDPVQFYIALSGLGYFYCSNRHTLGAVFGQALFEPERIASYEALAADMAAAYLRPPSEPSLPIPPEYRDGVMRQLALNQALAAPLLRFELPDSVGPAPVFRP